MSNFNRLKDRLMRDPEFARAYEQADVEYELIEAALLKRISKIAAMQQHVDDSLASGIGTRSRDELFEAALHKNEH